MDLIAQGFAYKRMVSAHDNSPDGTVSTIVSVESAFLAGRAAAPIGVAATTLGKVMTFALDMRAGKNVAYITYAERDQ